MSTSLLTPVYRIANNELRSVRSMSQKNVKNAGKSLKNRKKSKPADENTQNIISVLKTPEQEHILNNETAFSIREAYNVLRTNLIFSIPKECSKIIGVTSAERAEGKSINILNLAICIAETNARVLLIDCDMRIPKIYRLLDLSASPGIANVIVGLETVDKTIKATRFANLHVLVSGNVQPNPTELLGSERFGNLVHRLSEMYDFILIDTPPVNLVADASIISKHLAGYVFVVHQGLSERDSVVYALQQLKFVNAKILGFLLNGVTYSGSRYKYKYKKYGGYEYKSKTAEPAPAVSAADEDE